ncbi:MAG TPA: hypothetical protein PLP42_01765 [Acidobacteriota bacterium]|nr:hypothetical protein [Acidobacteriota bacterium]
MLYLLLSISLLQPAPPPTPQDVIALLRGDQWAEAVDIVRKHPQEYSPNQGVRDALLFALSRQTDRLKLCAEQYASGHPCPPPENKSEGEYFLDLLQTVIEWKISGSGPALLDALYGNAPEDAVAAILSQDTEEARTVFELIQRRYYSDHPFDRSNRVAYLRTVAKFLDKKPLRDPSRQSTVVGMVLDGLNDWNFMLVEAAVRASRHFMKHPLVVARVRQIAATDEIGLSHEAKRAVVEARKVLEEPSVQ